MQLLQRLFPRFFNPITPSVTKAELKQPLPITISHVKGFNIEVERKDGCILRSRPEKSATDVPYTDIGSDWYFEVRVTYDGLNPDYRGARGPWKRLLTNAQRASDGFGMVGNIDYRPPDERFSRIEIFEEFEDYKGYECFGDFPTPDHIVWLKIYTVDARGHESSFQSGLTTRHQYSSIRSSGSGSSG
jgi:hypothetical protein